MLRKHVGRHTWRGALIGAGVGALAAGATAANDPCVDESCGAAAGWAILESDAALARALFHEAAKLGPDQEARRGEALAGLRLNDPAPGLALLALDSNVTRPDDIQTRQISVAADALVLAAAVMSAIMFIAGRSEGTAWASAG